MTEHQPEDRDVPDATDQPAPGQPAHDQPARDQPASGLITPAAVPAEGGEAACWAHLVCYDCGSMLTEGHRPGCASAPGGAAPATQ
jgi:hypothetical protein